MFELTDKVAVVTGAGKGIGRGIAVCLARMGADVVLASRSEADLEAVAMDVQALGRRALVVPTDVTDEDALAHLGQAAVDSFGPVSIWVNNAGGLPDATPRYLTRTPPDRWDAQMDLNLKAVWVGALVAAEHMSEGGSIINISSSASRQGSFKNGPYAAAKAAVNSLTSTLALELAPKIRVNGVAPGPIPTENFNASTNFPEGKPLEKLLGIPLARMGEPDDIGHAVGFFASDEASWITGQTLFVTGGL